MKVIETLVRIDHQWTRNKRNSKKRERERIPLAWFPDRQSQLELALSVVPRSSSSADLFKPRSPPLSLKGLSFFSSVRTELPVFHSVVDITSFVYHYSSIGWRIKWSGRWWWRRWSLPWCLPSRKAPGTGPLSRRVRRVTSWWRTPCRAKPNVLAFLTTCTGLEMASATKSWPRVPASPVTSSSGTPRKSRQSANAPHSGPGWLPMENATKNTLKVWIRDL